MILVSNYKAEKCASYNQTKNSFYLKCHLLLVKWKCIIFRIFITFKSSLCQFHHRVTDLLICFKITRLYFSFISWHSSSRTKITVLLEIIEILQRKFPVKTLLISHLRACHTVTTCYHLHALTTLKVLLVTKSERHEIFTKGGLLKVKLLVKKKKKERKKCEFWNFDAKIE